MARSPAAGARTSLVVLSAQLKRRHRLRRVIAVLFAALALLVAVAAVLAAVPTGSAFTSSGSGTFKSGSTIYYRSGAGVSGTMTLTGTATGAAAANFQAGYAAAVDSTPNIRAYWRLGEASGTSAKEMTGVYNGTYVGSPTLGATGALASDADKAVTFTGAAGKAVSGTSIGNVNGSFTVEAWAKPTAATGGIVGSRTSGSDFGFDLTLITGKIHGDVGTGNAWLSQAMDANYTYTSGTWYHIVYVIAPGSYTIYLNGSQIGSGTLPSGTPLLTNNQRAFGIGGINVAGATPFTGSIDEVAVFTRALTATEIANHYAARVALTGWTPTPAVPAIDTASPYSENYAWANGTASSPLISARMTDAAGLAAAPQAFTLTPDATAPAVSWTSPAADTFRATTGTFTTTWSETEAGSGIGTRSAQWQSALLTDGACGTFTATGSAFTPSVGTATSPSLVAATCYRLVVSLTDNVGNLVPSNSPATKVDDTPPTVAATNSVTGAAYAADANATTIYFGPLGTGSITLTSTGTDAESTIGSSTFGALSAPSGWTYTPGTVTGNPTNKVLGWSVTAATSTVSVSATNQAGTASSAAVLTLMADSTGPSTAFTAPVGSTSQTVPTVTLSWSTVTDTGSGVASSTIQRNMAAATDSSQCAAATYAPDGAPFSGSSGMTDTTESGTHCYTWTITVVDRVGNSASFSSGMVFVSAVPPGAPGAPDLDTASDSTNALPFPPPLAETSGTYSGSSVWHYLSVVQTAAAAADLLSMSHALTVSSNCVGQHKWFTYEVINSTGNLLRTATLETTTDSTNGTSLNLSGTAVAIATEVPNDWLALRVRVSSSCNWQSTPPGTLSVTTVSAPGSPPTVESPPPYSGSNVFHTVALVTGRNDAPGMVVSGSYDAWMSSNCFGQQKNFTVRLTDSYGAVLASSIVSAGADNTGGHDAHAAASFSVINRTWNNWFALQIADSASCVWYQTPAPTLTITGAAPNTGPATPIYDNITSDDTPSFTGTVDPAATAVTLFDGATLVGTDSAPSGGLWHITASPLADGARSLTAKAVGPGGTSANGPPLTVTIDTTVPAAPSIPDLKAAGDSGLSNTDNITTAHGPSYPNVFNGPLATGTYPADSTSNKLLPKIFSTAAETPTITWDMSYTGYTGRMSAGMDCSDGSNLFDDNTSSGATHTKTWPSGASWCQIYAWANGGGTFTVTGGGATYHDPAVAPSFQFLGTGSTDSRFMLYVAGSRVATKGLESTATITPGTYTGAGSAVRVSLAASATVAAGPVTVRISTTGGSGSNFFGVECTAAVDGAITTTGDVSIPSAGGFVTTGTCLAGTARPYMRNGSGSTLNLIATSSWSYSVAPVPGEYALGPALELPDGTTAITVRGQDVAGNLSASSNPLTVELVQYVRKIGGSAQPSASVGQAVWIVATAQNEVGDPASDYNGILSITGSAGSGAVFPDGTTFALSTATGTTGHAFRVLFGSPGARTVTVSAPGMVSATYPVAVGATSLTASAPATAYVGIPIVMTVGARDAANNPIPTYNGLLTFTSSDSGASFIGGIDATNQYRMICGCEAGHPVLVSFASTGTQTVTTTDEFGNTKQISVNVLAAPASIPVPTGLAAYAVQWSNGHTVDYYIKNTTGETFTTVEAYTACNNPDPPHTEPVGISLTDPYVEFTTHIATVRCWVAGSGAYNLHHVIIIDSLGHKWDLPASRYERFSDVPGNGNFTSFDEGDPLNSSSVAVVSRADGPIEHVGEPGSSSGFFNVARGQTIVTINATEQTKLIGYSYPGQPSITQWAIESDQQARYVPAGTNTYVFDNIPWACYFGPQNNGTLRLQYVDPASGRDGYREFGVGQPGAAPPGLCDDPNGGRGYDINGNERGRTDNPYFGDADIDTYWKQVTDRIGDPVDAYSGSQTADLTDFNLGGLSPSLTLTRAYRSSMADMLWRGLPGAHQEPLLFGPGWGSLLDSNLNFPTADRTTVRTNTGYYEFIRKTDGTWAASNNDVQILTSISGGWKITQLDGSGLRFDGDGRLAAIFEPHGRELTLGWVAGKLESLTDGSGRTASVTTNAAGQVTRVDLPGGRYVAYTYSAGYLRTFRDLGGTVLTYNTDIRGRITSVTNAAGDPLLRNVFDQTGRVVAQYDALNHPTFLNYDDKAFLQSNFPQEGDTAVTRTIIDPRGGASLNCYNTKGMLVGSVDPLGGVKRWTYDPRGNVNRTVDEVGAVSAATYNASHEPTAVTDAASHTTTVTWDAFGHPLVIGSPSGTATTIVVDPTTHLPTSITNSDATHSQQVAGYTYDPTTKLPVTVVAEGGATTTVHYDARGYVDYTIDPEGRKTTFVTDANTGLVSATVDPLGNATGGVPGDHRTTYTYDDAGHVLTVTDPLGNMAGGNPTAHRTTYTYDSMGRLKTESRASGATTTYNYDLAGQISSIVVKLDATHTATTLYEYDAAGNLTAVVDPESRRTETTYDLNDRPVTVTDPNTKTTTTEYDAKGRVTKLTDPTGVFTRTFYDGIDRVTKITDSAGKDTTYGYDPETGLLTSVTDPLSHATSYGYDWIGRQASVTNAKNQTSYVGYDDQGNIATVVNARNKTTTFTSNLTHQLLTVTEPGDTGNLITTYAYDEAGRLHTRQNARGAIETYDYDSLNRPTKLTDPVGKIWQSFYTDDGDIDHTIDGKGQTTPFEYDLAGRLLTVTPAAPTAAVTYTYDKSDRLLTMADGNGTTTYDYDPDGHLASVLRGGRTAGYTYDDAGRLETVVYPGGLGTVAYDYDAAGRPSTITDWASRVTTYHYDDASRVSSVDRPGGLTVAYTFDELDRPLTATSTRSGSTLLSQAWTFDPDGNIATYADDTGTASFTYDNLDRLLTAAYPSSQNYTYTYDAVGNTLTAATPSGTATYTYDLADRITSAGPAGPPTPGSSTRSSSSNDAGWTSSGNATTSDNVYATAAPAKNATKTVNYGNFGFNSTLPTDATALTVTGTVEWKVSVNTSIATLDAQAYVSGSPVGTILTNTSSPTNDTTQTFTISGLTRAQMLDGTFQVRVRATRGNSNTAFTASLDLVSVKVDYTSSTPGTAPTYDNNGNMTSDGSYGNRTYAYDTFGRLLSVVSGGATTTYSLDGSGNRWSQTTGAATTNFDLDLSTGNPTILYDGTAKYLAGAPGSGYEAGGTWKNALTDLIGSPIEFVDTAGAVSGLTHYDPYGAPRPGSGAAVGIGYAGEYRDGSGLINLRARSYDPVLARFIGRDTFAGVMSAPQTGNRYSYATTNPLRFSDPSGHFVQAVIDHPWTVVEIIVSFNPVGALVISSYILITGTDPATGERVDPQWGLLGIATVILPPIVAKAIMKVLGGMVRGIGNVIGRAVVGGGTIARDVGAGARAFGTVAREGAALGTAARESAAAAGAAGRDVAAVGRAEADAGIATRVAESASAKPLQGGEAGRFSELRARGVSGDELTPHHIPQAAAARTGYNEGGALVLPQSEHVLTRTYGAKGAAAVSADASLTFRQVLARDIWDIKRISGSRYNAGLRDLIDYYRTNFPELLTKVPAL